MKTATIATLAFLALLSTLGCGSAGNSGGNFDNTGGAPPPGTPVAYTAAPFPLDALCTSQLVGPRTAVLARVATDIPTLNGNESCSASLRTALASTFAALSADQSVALFTLGLGGCVRSYEVARVYRDGPVLRPWILLHDTTLGARGSVSCTADFLAIVAALVVDGSTGANAIALSVGSVNPNYPRNASVPVF